MKRAVSLRLVGVFLAATMLLGTLMCLPFSVSADSEGEFEYTIDNGEATVMKYTGKGGAVVIPDMLGSYPVTASGRSMDAQA